MELVRIVLNGFGAFMLGLTIYEFLTLNGLNKIHGDFITLLFKGFVILIYFGFVNWILK